MSRSLPCSLGIASVLLSSVVRAQAIGGRVLDQQTGQPLFGVAVTIASDSGTPLVRETTRRDGTFILTLPRAGRFAPHFVLSVDHELVGDSITVGADDFVQREFRLVMPVDPVYFAYQVLKPVVPIAGNRGPTYPPELRAVNAEGIVVAEFVVEPSGNVRANSFRALRTSDLGFVAAVRTAVLAMRFHAAEVNGRKVAQLVQQSFEFRLTASSMPTRP